MFKRFKILHSSAQWIGDREEQQDALIVHRKKQLFGVADGLGGHAGGKIASGIAANAIKQHFNPTLLSTFSNAVREAHIQIYTASFGKPEISEMGTTATVAHAAGNKLHVRHVGDSRLYRLRGGKLEQLTKDHTLPHVVYGAVLSRCLGGSEAKPPEIDDPNFDIQHGDKYLIASDGVLALHEDEIKEILTSSKPKKAAAKLIERVKALQTAGSELDNVSAVVLEARESALKRFVKSALARFKKRKRVS